MTNTLLSHKATLSFFFGFSILHTVMFVIIHSGIAWIEFLNTTDNFGETLSRLREGDIKGAQLLWLRYEVTND